MSRRNLKSNFVKHPVEGVSIVDISEDGKGIGKKEGEVYFIKGSIPGEKLNIEVYGQKKGVKEATILAVVENSPLRAMPFCEHFGECGGCKWQHLTYEGQLLFKEKNVIDAFIRIGKLDSEELSKIRQPILASEETQYYRNKLEFTFTHRRWKSNQEMATPTDTDLRGLGFHVPGSFDKILDIHRCYLQKEPSNLIRNFIRGKCLIDEVPFFNLREQTGILRNLIIRTSSLGEVMVILVFAQDEPFIIQGLMKSIDEEFPDLTSLQYIINKKKNDTFLDQEIILFKGKDAILEKMGALFFRISAKSFFQTNSLQAIKLYELASNLCNFQGDELVFDLYTGTGTIANYIASKVKHVIGLEYVEDAILDARKNAELNGIQNVEFHTGDIKDLLSAPFLLEKGKPHIIITDPPRAGMHPEVLKRIMEIKSPKILYISCNPSTQARDLLILRECYHLASLQPVDMFPQTQHVENIVLLTLKSETHDE